MKYLRLVRGEFIIIAAGIGVLLLLAASSQQGDDELQPSTPQSTAPANTRAAAPQAPGVDALPVGSPKQR